MAVIGVKTDLVVSVEAAVTPKTALLYSVDAGTGIQESHVQVPNGVDATLSLGKATTGTKTQQRLIKKAINTRSDVAAP